MAITVTLILFLCFLLAYVASHGDRDEDFDVPLRAQAAVYQNNHQYMDAVSLYERAIAQDPEKVWVYLPLVQAMERANRQAADGAVIVYSKDDFMTKLEEMRSKLRQMPRSDPNIHANETETDKDFHRLPIDIAGGCDTYFALFIAAANSGQYGPAWRYLEAATSFEASKRNVQADQLKKQAEAQFNQDQKIFSSAIWESTNQAAFDPKTAGINLAPIFILGMPGSGKELLERVLSAHANIKSMDINAKYFDTDFYQGPKRSVFESLYPGIRSAIVAALQGSQPGGLQGVIKEQVMKVLNNAYGRMQFVGDSLDFSQPIYYIDSSPQLHALLGWVQFIFPKAVVIHATRSPMDVIYDAHRSWPDIRIAEDHVFDMGVLPYYVAVFYHYIAHWHQTLGPGRIIHINMDAVAEDPERELIPLLKKLGLRWTKEMTDKLYRVESESSRNTDGRRLYRAPLEFSPAGSWRGFSLGLAHVHSMINRLWGEQVPDMLVRVPFAESYTAPDWENPYVRTRSPAAHKFSRKLDSSKQGNDAKKGGSSSKKKISKKNKGKTKKDKKKRKNEKDVVAGAGRSLEYITDGPADMWATDGCAPAEVPSLPTERDALGAFLEQYFEVAHADVPKVELKIDKDGKKMKRKKRYRNSNSKQPLVGVEIGVQEGKFSELVLNGWASCSKYIMIDAWEEQDNYFDDANVDTAEHLRLLQSAQKRLERFSVRGVELDFRRNYSVDALAYIEDLSVDFIYIDARHDYCGAAEDLWLYWSKLKPGGIFAGHDYLERRQMIGLGVHSGQRWDICQNRSIRTRAVKGAVDDFIDDLGLRGAATYTDGSPWLSWLVRKPCVDIPPVNWRL